MDESRPVIVFHTGRCWHMPYTEQMPGTSVPLADLLTVCRSQVGFERSEGWARGRGLRPCRLCYGGEGLSPADQVTRIGLDAGLDD